MKSALFVTMAVFGLAALAPAQEGAPSVILVTTMGEIVIELDQENAPDSVGNFLQYVDAGFYNGTIFHRVIDRFMIQGGGFTEDMTQKKTRSPIGNEADNGLSNVRGTVAMARRGDPHSASAQFFINTVDNTSLDHRDKTVQGWGYTVFGTVVEGMDVVDDISAVSTSNQGAFRDVPREPVIIVEAKRRGAV